MGFLQPIGNFYVSVGMDASELRKEVNRINRVMRQQIGSEAVALSQTLAKAVTGLGAAFVAAGITSVKMAADMEQQQIAFKTMLRSGDAAKNMLEDLEQFSMKTPFEFSELVSAARRLMALGYEANQVIPILTTVGNAAAGLGTGSVGIDRMTLAFGQMKAKGKVAAQEMNQLAEAGVPAWEMLAKSIGKSIPEAMKEAENKIIPASVALPAIFKSMNERFNGLMVEQSGTISGMAANMVEAIYISMRASGERIAKALNLKPAMKSLLETMNKFAADVKASGISEAINNAVGEPVRVGVILLAGAITGTLVPALISAASSAALMAYGLAPYALLGALIVGIGYSAKKLYDGISENFEKLKYMALSTLNDLVAAVQESVAKVILAIQKIAEAMPYAPGVDTISEDYVKLVQAAHASREAAHQARVEYNNLDVTIQRAGRSMVLLVTNSGSVERIFSGISSRIMQLVPWIGELARQFGALTNTWINSPAPISTPAPIPGSGKKGSDLAREAKSISDSIKSEWMQATKDEETILNDWYDKQLEQLNKSKAASKTYHDDLIRLKETYLSKVRDLSEKEYDKQMEDLSLAKQKQADEEKQALDNAARNEDIQNQLAEELNARIEAVKSGQKIEQQLWKDYRTCDMQAYLQHVNQQNIAFVQSLRGRQEAISLHQKLLEDSHRSSLSYMVEGYQTLYTGLTDALVGVITGSKSAAQAMKELGMQLITMVVKWMVQRQLAATMSKGLEKAMTASSVASAALTAKAWAPAAAMVAAATFGASTATAAAGLTALSGLSRALAIPGLAKGGIVTSPTLAMIGEGKGPEAVIPLDRLGNMGGETRVTVNVHNNTGTPTQARQQTTRNGQEVVVDLFLDAFARDVNGLRTVLKGA